MVSRQQLELLTDLRLQEAEYLLAAGFAEGAFYLAGYAVELCLKAQICKALNVENFFDDSFLKSFKYPHVFRTHDFNSLLRLSGLHNIFERDQLDFGLKAHWSTIAKWDSGSRYIAGQDFPEVTNFVTSIKAFISWTRLH